MFGIAETENTGIAVNRSVENSMKSFIIRRVPLLADLYRALRAAVTVLHEVTGTWVLFARRFLIFLGFRKNRKDTKEYKRILIAGGYGYGNIGDEAQLAANLENWNDIVPDCRLTILTPNRELTRTFHRLGHVELAPRVVFFNEDRSQNYDRSNLRFKLHFFMLTPILLFNARLCRADLPLFLISARAARLLDVIYNSDLLFLSGGGYLTGHTLSRLWDNMLLIRLADILGVPAILSGQSIGVWEHDGISRAIARWGLKKVGYISVRDADDSLRALKAIGIDGNHVESTCDDALFCADVQEEKIPDILRRRGIDPEIPYLIASVHGTVFIEHLATFFDSLKAQYPIQVAFIQMHPHDNLTAQSIIAAMDRDARLIEYIDDVEETVAIIRHSALCITMKHHPIIFAMGNGVPVISIADSTYYDHKNRGALSIFGLEAFSIYCQPDTVCESVSEKFDELWGNRKRISYNMRERFRELTPLKAKAIRQWISEHDPYQGLRAFRDIHNGQRCFILGTGPSLNKTNLGLLKDEIVIGVNTFYRGMSQFGISCMYYCVSDVTVWRNHYREILDLDTILFLSGEAGEDYVRHHSHYSTYRRDRIHAIQRKDDSRYLAHISEDITQGMYWGGTVIIDACLQIAYYMGFKNTYLLGCDCDYSGLHHFDGTTTDELNGPGVKGEWDGIFRSYEVCRTAFERAGRRIVNCTVGGKLEVFDRERLEDVL